MAEPVGGCSRCGRRWRSTTECHCPTCHRQFGGARAFEIHRRDGVCRDPATLHNRAGGAYLRLLERPGGPVWVRIVTHVFRRGSYPPPAEGR